MAQNNKVESVVQNGQLVEIRIAVSGLTEIDIYRNLIKSDVPVCPHCGATLDPKPEDMKIIVSNPLVSFGMELGVPVTKCQKCQKMIDYDDDNGTLDLSAFPSIINYLVELRKEYQRRAKAAAAKHKRGNSR